MRMHKVCPTCFNTYGDNSEAYADDECPYCIECLKCDKTSDTFESMYQHHTERHGHDSSQPLHEAGNYAQTRLTEAEECTCSPH